MLISLLAVVLAAALGVRLTRPLREPEKRRRAFARTLIADVVRTFPRDAENARATHRFSDDLSREVESARRQYLRRFASADAQAAELARAVDDLIWHRPAR